MSEERMKEFANHFEKVLFPTIKGEDGDGVNRLRKIVEEKREAVQKRKEKRNPK